MKQVYKVTTKAEDYPFCPCLIEAHNISLCVSVSKDKDFNYKVGDSYKNLSNAYIERIIYNPKKWWQFWKKKRAIAAIVRID